MHPMGNPRDHFWLTIGMSKAVGANLGDALRDGKLTQRSYAEIINACRTCDNPQGCKHWLDQNPSATAAPDYCRNKTELAALASS
ncbi:DUF6455 family protein [Aestuariibius sp. HNIBRBA575]|uniref:DUF6455 family protein n=1 Tax=Aestuariibius sp. HNIBRBA575 TaxID=3233343 RepID=UPI0034A2BA76